MYHRGYGMLSHFFGEPNPPRSRPKPISEQEYPSPGLSALLARLGLATRVPGSGSGPTKEVDGARSMSQWEEPWRSVETAYRRPCGHAVSASKYTSAHVDASGSFGSKNKWGVLASREVTNSVWIQGNIHSCIPCESSTINRISSSKQVLRLGLLRNYTEPRYTSKNNRSYREFPHHLPRTRPAIQ